MTFYFSLRGEKIAKLAILLDKLHPV